MARSHVTSSGATIQFMLSLSPTFRLEPDFPDAARAFPQLRFMGSKF